MPTNIRIGHGFDVHAFCEGESIILAGIRIPFSKAFEAHSDGDVLIHALCDAMLGSVAAGDIGQLFPDTDSQYKDIDSQYFLNRVNDLLIKKGFRLINADITIIAQKPKIAPHQNAMRLNLCNILSCDESTINIKGTTTEHLGYIGREEGIAVHAVVLVEKQL